MQLSQFDHTSEQLTDVLITGISGCKVWYVHDGRNAWHATWVERYTDGCLHLRIESAKQYCESLRTKGSVFYIHERPAIRIDTERGVFVVVEIGTKNPLKNYSVFPKLTEFRESGDSEKLSPELILKIGEKLLPAAQSFWPHTDFWTDPRPDFDFVILSWLNRDKLFTMYMKPDGGVQAIDLRKPELLTGKAMHSYVSSSDGGSYLLRWTKKESLVKQRGVLNILRSAGVFAEVQDIKQGVSTQRRDDA